MDNSILISNFKSIKTLEFNPKRVCLLIGKPNVGKSNILEALSLFDIPFVFQFGGDGIKDLARYNNISNLFFDNQTGKDILIQHDKRVVNIFESISETKQLFDVIIAETPDNRKYKSQQNSLYSLNFLDIKELDKDNVALYAKSVDIKGTVQKGIKNNTYFSDIKKYIFNPKVDNDSNFNEFLIPPYGQNLHAIIERNTELFNEIAGFFEDYKLEVLFDPEKTQFEIQKKVGRISYKYPFLLLADTLQRIIFYLTAIRTNQDSLLLFEEPETNAYPPYIKFLAEEIVKSENRFIMSTHSPYLLNNIIENVAYDELSIYITYLEDYQTKLKELSQEEIKEITDDYIDVFFNLERFLN
ncbi:MAG: AAA family ATPase [Bacteroidales bacterium]|nr:AAA family ATPase [Bacteroidales bacterium]